MEKAAKVIERPYSIKCGGGRTQQHFKDQVNINRIVERAKRGQMIPTNGMNPMYGNFTDIGTYQEAHNLVLKVEEGFMELPVRVRERFKNNPFELLEFVGDNNNKEEAIKLGLIKPDPIPEPEKVQKVEIVEKKAKAKDSE